MKCRPSLSTLLALTLAAAISTAIIPPVAAEDSYNEDRPGAWLPRLEDIGKVADGVSAWSTASLADALADGEASARRCRIGPGKESCRCLTMRSGRLTLSAERVERRGESVEVRGLSASFEDAPVALYAGRWTYKSGEKTSHRVDDLTVVSTEDALPLMTAHTLAMGGDDGGVRYKRLAWFEAFSRPSQTQSCEKPAPRPDGEPAARAADVARRDRDYRIDGFRIGGLPVRPFDYEADAPGPVSGFLPPSLVYSRETAELGAAYLIAPVSLGPRASASPGEWYGGGLTITDRMASSDGPGFDTSGAPLEVELRHTVGGEGLSGAALGESTWGTPYRNASAEAEAVGDERFWRTGRIGREATFRPWRYSRLGASASGPAHVLGARLLRPVTLEDDGLSTLDEVTGGRLEAGTTRRLGEATTADFAASHAMLVADSRDEQLSRLAANVEHTVGSPGRAYLRPGLRSWFASGASGRSGERDWATSAQLLGVLEAGLVVEGRFDGLLHRVEPRAVLAREVVGLSREPLVEDLGVDQATAWLDAHRRPQWSFGGAILDQELVMARNWRVALPAGVLLEGNGLDEFIEARPLGIAGVEVRQSAFDASAQAMSDVVFEEVAWTVRAGASAGAFEFDYRGARLDAAMADTVALVADASGSLAMLDSLQTGSLRRAGDTQAATTIHSAGLAWHRARLRAAVRGYWRPGDDGLGVSVGNTLAVPELGWAIGWRVDVSEDPRDTGLFLGLSESP